MKYRDHQRYGLVMPHMDPSILMFKQFPRDQYSFQNLFINQDWGSCSVKRPKQMQFSMTNLLNW